MAAAYSLQFRRVSVTEFRTAFLLKARRIFLQIIGNIQKVTVGFFQPAIPTLLEMSDRRAYV